MFPEMSKCCMPCAAIRHLLGRQLIYRASVFFFSLPQRSDSLKVLFTNLCLLLREDDESDKSQLRE